MRYATAVLAMLVLSGCFSARERSEEWAQLYAPADSHPSYLQGWKDGCHTQQSETCELAHIPDRARIRDEPRMRSDPEYAIGWNDGARKCDYCRGASTFIFVPRR